MKNARCCLFSSFCILFALAFGLVQPASANGHNAMSAADGGCIIAVGPYKVQFTGYIPDARLSGEYCQNIPMAGRTIISLDQVDTVLRRMPMELHIIRDDRHLGANARYEDVARQYDISRAPLYHKTAEVYKNGNAIAELSFDEGSYLGVVTLYDPVTRQTFASVVPFTVGAGNLTVYAIWLVKALFLAAVAAAMVMVIEGRYVPPAGRPA